MFNSSAPDYQINLEINNTKSSVALNLHHKPYVASVGTFVSGPKPVNAKQANGHGGTISADIMTGEASGIIVYTFPYDPSTILILGASIDAQSVSSEAKVSFVPAETTIDDATAEKFMNDPKFTDAAKKQFKAHTNPDGTGPFYLTVKGETRGHPPNVTAVFTITKSP